jgi:lipopolysaccharide export system permease protein
MKIVHKLYLKDFFKLLCLLSIGLSSIFSLIDLTGKIDDFSSGKNSAASVAAYALLNMPKFFIYLLPMSVLISSLYTFSQAFHRREITAIKTAGGRLRTFFYPFVIAGLILSIFAFITSEIIVPEASRKASELKHSLEKDSGKVIFTDGGLWLKAKNGSPVKIELYVSEKKVANGVSIFVLGEGLLKEKIVAKRAYWNGVEWILEDITKYDIGTGKIEEYKTVSFNGLESPEFLTKDIRPTDEMGIFELQNYMQKLRRAGFRNIKLAVDINSKISFPLINIFMMLLGISLSVRVGFGGALFSSGLGLFISLLYWFSYTFSLSLGYAGIAPPLLSAWVIPGFFGAFAVYLFMKIPE